MRQSTYEAAADGGRGKAGVGTKKSFIQAGAVKFFRLTSTRE
jgi:hypothetical protein